jgi:hypothetical protein
LVIHFSTTAIIAIGSTTAKLQKKYEPQGAYLKPNTGKSRGKAQGKMEKRGLQFER